MSTDHLFDHEGQPLINSEATRRARDAKTLERMEDEAVARCACGKELDENGEHDGGYGAWCG